MHTSVDRVHKMHTYYLPIYLSTNEEKETLARLKFFFGFWLAVISK